MTLTSYTGPTTISKCGVVIDSKIVSGEIVVTAGNGTHSPDTPCVTIKNSLVKGVIHTDAASYGPVVVTDTEVAVPGLSWWENIGRYNVFVWRVNSHGSEGSLSARIIARPMIPGCMACIWVGSTITMRLAVTAWNQPVGILLLSITGRVVVTLAAGIHRRGRTPVVRRT